MTRSSQLAAAIYLGLSFVVHSLHHLQEIIVQMHIELTILVGCLATQGPLEMLQQKDRPLGMRGEDHLPLSVGSLEQDSVCSRRDVERFQSISCIASSGLQSLYTPE